MRRGLTIDVVPTARAQRALRVAAGVGITGTVAGIVWFFGFDTRWAIAAAIALLSMCAVVVTFAPVAGEAWAPPAPRTPRGTRLAVTTIEQSLAACDRLARPAALRRLRALLVPEREDQIARLLVVRRLRALLVAERQDRRLDATAPREALLLLLGPHARAVLQPHGDTPISAATVARCLDAVERIATPTPGFP